MDGWIDRPNLNEYKKGESNEKEGKEKCLMNETKEGRKRKKEKQQLKLREELCDFGQLKPSSCTLHAQ